MKVKELPENTDITKVKVELPEMVLKAFKAYTGGKKHMYPVGNTMGEFWFSPNKPTKSGKGTRRLYALPYGYMPSVILEWEVVDDQD